MVALLSRICHFDDEANLWTGVCSLLGLNLIGTKMMGFTKEGLHFEGSCLRKVANKATLVEAIENHADDGTTQGQGHAKEG